MTADEIESILDELDANHAEFAIVSKRFDWKMQQRWVALSASGLMAIAGFIAFWWDRQAMVMIYGSFLFLLIDRVLRPDTDTALAAMSALNKRNTHLLASL